jgi:hypothetical protein
MSKENKQSAAASSIYSENKHSDTDNGKEK